MSLRIEYCVRCQWMLRACWYQQEILQTFVSKAKYSEEALIKEITLVPSFESATFRVSLLMDKSWIVVWDRSIEKGFPDSKILKGRIRDLLDPSKGLGHVDRGTSGALLGENNNECVECKEQA
ncbi:hypothetical protein DAMA08_030820 [Martiniozyma asiatica (nom. inval.)]|nr:hypothetical protein DAMA08_030820 [Martiniozyma asiatica]